MRRKPLVNYSSQKGRRAKRRNPVTGWGNAAEKINSFLWLLRFLGMILHTYDLSTWGAEAGGSRDQMD